jgi:hypothetical protein
LRSASAVDGISTLLQYYVGVMGGTVTAAKQQTYRALPWADSLHGRLYVDTSLCNGMLASALVHVVEHEDHGAAVVRLEVAGALHQGVDGRVYLVLVCRTAAAAAKHSLQANLVSVHLCKTYACDASCGTSHACACLAFTMLFWIMFMTLSAPPWSAHKMFCVRLLPWCKGGSMHDINDTSSQSMAVASSCPNMSGTVICM